MEPEYFTITLDSGQVAHTVMITCDWKEQFKAKDVEKALKVLSSFTPLFIYNVDDTGADYIAWVFHDLSDLDVLNQGQELFLKIEEAENADTSID